MSVLFTYCKASVIPLRTKDCTNDLKGFFHASRSVVRKSNMVIKLCSPGRGERDLIAVCVLCSFYASVEVGQVMWLEPRQSRAPVLTVVRDT